MARKRIEFHRGDAMVGAFWVDAAQDRAWAGWYSLDGEQDDPTSLLLQSVRLLAYNPEPAHGRSDTGCPGFSPAPGREQPGWPTAYLGWAAVFRGCVCKRDQVGLAIKGTRPAKISYNTMPSE